MITDNLTQREVDEIKAEAEKAFPKSEENPGSELLLQYAYGLGARIERQRAKVLLGLLQKVVAIEGIQPSSRFWQLPFELMDEIIDALNTYNKTQ